MNWSKWEPDISVITEVNPPVFLPRNPNRPIVTVGPAHRWLVRARSVQRPSSAATPGPRPSVAMDPCCGRLRGEERSRWSRPQVEPRAHLLRSRKCDVLNRGFSGYNTRWARIILPRLIASGSGLESPAAVTVFFGANDSALKGDALLHVRRAQLRFFKTVAFIPNPFPRASGGPSHPRLTAGAAGSEGPSLRFLRVC